MKKNFINELDFFLVTLTTISAILIYIARIGFDNDISIILKSVSLSYIIILLPRLIYNSISKSLKKKFSLPLIILLVIFSILILSYTNTIEGLNLFILLLVFGPILIIYFFIGNILNVKFNIKNSLFFLFSIIFSVFLTAVYYNNNYTNPLMIEKIINGSWAHRDILYHASISGMLKTYLFLGTGLDGFVPHSYHFFSHLIFGQFSKILGINTLDFYSIAFPIIITPIFFMFFLNSIKDVSLFFSKVNNFEIINEKNFFLWLLLFIFFSLPLSPSILSEKYHYLQSQSYAFALSILFLLIGIFFHYVNNINKNDTNQFFNYFIPLTILILCIFCSYSKISFVLLFSLIGLYFFIRFSLYKNIYLFILFFLWLLFFIFIYINLIVTFDGKDLFLNAIPTLNYSQGNQFSFIYISILYILLKAISLKIFSLKILIINIKNKKILDLEIFSILIITMYFIPFQYIKGIQLYIAYIFFISHINLFSNLIFNK